MTEGPVCVLRAVEPCRSFKMIPGKGRPRLVSARRKCLFFCFYFLDRELGLVHVRIQSWFPLVIQICLNRHELLARKLDKHDIAYHKQDNAFTWIEDAARDQRLADKVVRINWPKKLSAFARRVNPLLADLLKGMNYYWVTDQAEYAADVMFESPASLKPLYEKLVKHATLCFSAEDVELFVAVMRGEHTIHGIRNQDVRRQLFGTPANRQLRRRHANNVSRLLKRLHVHGLIAKIPRTRRWRITKRGTLLLTTVLKCHYERYPEILAALAA